MEFKVSTELGSRRKRAGLVEKKNGCFITLRGVLVPSKNTYRELVNSAHLWTRAPSRCCIDAPASATKDWLVGLSSPTSLRTVSALGVRDGVAIIASRCGKGEANVLGTENVAVEVKGVGASCLSEGKIILVSQSALLKMGRPSRSGSLMSFAATLA